MTRFLIALFGFFLAYTGAFAQELPLERVPLPPLERVPLPPLERVPPPTDYNSYVYREISGMQCGTLFFGSVEGLRRTYLSLSENYEANNGDEAVLDAFEQSFNLHSARAKEIQLDDAGLDATRIENFTSDEVLGSILNEHGIVVVERKAYLWDDGCTIITIPFQSCGDIQGLARAGEDIFTDAGNAARIAQHLASYDATIRDSCLDGRFDVDANWDLEGKYEVKEKGASGCGTSAFIKHTIVRHDSVTNEMEVRFEATGHSPPNLPVVNTFQIIDPEIVSNDPSDASQQSFITSNDQIELIDCDKCVAAGGYNTGSWLQQVINQAGGLYVGSWFQVKIDGNLLPQFKVWLQRVSGPLSGNSCAAVDTRLLDVTCPVSISVQQLSGSSSSMDFLFSVQGYDVPPGVPVNWAFGDGSVEVNGGAGTQHSYSNCYPAPFTVTANIEDSLCKNPLSVDLGDIGNSNIFWSYKAPKMKFKHNGKTFKAKSKLKESFFGTGSKIKNKLKYRKKGVTKEILVSGNVVLQGGNTCSTVAVQSTPFVDVLSSKSDPNPMSHSKRRKLRQKLKTYNPIGLDCSDPSPTTVMFTTQDGASHTTNMKNGMVCPQ